ncbi:MAG: hypothetical protein K1X89_01360 [Myxococcaceae bacterium]|nr:hypothetical protein [Myxococcaceae bacterium]
MPWVLVPLLAALTACPDRTRTQKIIEPFAIVPGQPAVDSKAPSVDTDLRMDNGNFSVASPRQCDLFQQLSVRKVDILWVVDSSGSMAPKQARLAANFNGFISQLVNATIPIDFHIGVVTTDTDDPKTRGALRTWSLAPYSGDYIACTPQPTGGSLCNTAPSVDGGTTAAVLAFNQMALVGTQGSAQERGLLAAYLALTNPANVSTASSERFIRNDAALYVVVVSDEDDSSCNPLVSQPTCTADPGCRCATDQTLGGPNAFGSTAYFTRFFETYKGYGNGDLVALAAIVAKDDGADAGVPSQFGEPTQHVGCCKSLNGADCPHLGPNDGGFEVAYFGGRYLKVAAETGGVAVNICDSDFQNALASLGYAASGLRREFRLSRGPELRAMGGKATGVELYVSEAPRPCQVDTQCSMSQTCVNNVCACMTAAQCAPGDQCRAGRCVKALDVALASAPNGAQYVKCDGSALRNIVRFDGNAVPESLASVEVCYDVQANFSNSCP